MSLVTVITPSYNQAPFLAETLRSVLTQDFPDLEYLVVDGGSSDGSVEIIQQHSRQLAWWISEPDAGQADAINKGLAHAHGEIVGWLNSDDLYLPGTIEAVARVFSEHPDIVLAYGNMRAIDEAGEVINTLRYRKLSLDDLLCFQIIGQPAAFMRRSAVEAAGGLDSSFNLLLDHHLWIKLARLGPILHIDQTWAAARYHAAAKNRAQAEGFGEEAFRILRWAEREPDLALVLQQIPKRAHAAAHRVDARYLVDGGRPAAALKAWVRSLALHPATALSRPNLLASAVLDLLGLGAVRRAVLRGRQRRLSR